MPSSDRSDRSGRVGSDGLPAHLLVPDQAARRFREAGVPVDRARPDYVRHKRGETTLIGYRLQAATDASFPERGFVRWFADPARASARDDKARRVHRGDPEHGPRRIDAHTVLHPFPHDPALRSLRWYATPRKLKRTLARFGPDGQVSGSRSTVEVLRYKPERRAVLRADLTTSECRSRPVLVRVAARRDGHRLAARATALLRAGVATPRPLGCLDGGSVTIDEWVEGVELVPAIAAGTIGPDELADALLRFHRATVDTDALDPVVLDTGAERDMMQAALDALSAWHPALADPARRLGGLARRRSGPRRARPVATLHGDLHDENVLVGSCGPTFVDLERMRRGDPAFDLGTLRGVALAAAIRRPAHADALAVFVERVIEAYRRGCALDDWTIDRRAAATIVDQALLAVRRVEPNATEEAFRLLDLAGSVLDGC